MNRNILILCLLPLILGAGFQSMLKPGIISSMASKSGRPGTVMLNPNPDGVHYTMPSLPTGAGSLILEKQSGADSSVWEPVNTGLAGGATGIDATGDVPLYSQFINGVTHYTTGPFEKNAFGSTYLQPAPGGGGTGGSGVYCYIVLDDGILTTYIPVQTWPMSGYQVGDLLYSPLLDNPYATASHFIITSIVHNKFFGFDSAVGKANKTYVYRVRTTNGNRVGQKSSCVTSDLPGVPGVGSTAWLGGYIDTGLNYTQYAWLNNCEVTAPSDVARHVVNSPALGNIYIAFGQTNPPDFNYYTSAWDFNPLQTKSLLTPFGEAIIYYFRFRAGNIYGWTEGDVWSSLSPTRPNQMFAPGSAPIGGTK